MSQSATRATQNDMTTCLETFEKERFCSFPHRHGINDTTTARRRPDDDATIQSRRTRVQPPDPQTINGNPSLRIRPNRGIQHRQLRCPPWGRLHPSGRITAWCSSGTLCWSSEASMGTTGAACCGDVWCFFP